MPLEVWDPRDIEPSSALGYSGILYLNWYGILLLADNWGSYLMPYCIENWVKLGGGPEIFERGNTLSLITLLPMPPWWRFNLGLGLF